MSLLCCSRLSNRSSSERPNPGRLGGPNVSTSLPAINLSTFNERAAVASDADISDVIMTSSRDKGTSGRTQLLTVPGAQFLTVNHMKQAVSIESLDSDNDDCFL